MLYGLCIEMAWPLCPGSLCPGGRGGKFSLLFLPKTDLLTKVMTRNQRQYNVTHKTMDFQKKSHKFVKRFIQISYIHKIVAINALSSLISI